MDGRCVIMYKIIKLQRSFKNKHICLITMYINIPLLIIISEILLNFDQTKASLLGVPPV